MILLKPALLPDQNVVTRVKATGSSLSFPNTLALTAGKRSSQTQVTASKAAIASHYPAHWLMQLCLVGSMCAWIILLVALFLSTVVSGGRLLLFLMVLRAEPRQPDPRFSMQNIG
jgi:hypothetical protein